MELDIYLKQGKTDILIKKLDDAVAADDQNKIYYFARASTYEKLNKPEMAEADYMKAVEIDPEYYDANFNLGVLYVNKARPLIEKMQKTYTKPEQNALEIEIKSMYGIALVYFEKCLAIGVPENNKVETLELVQSMQRLYKNIDYATMEKSAKEFVDAESSQFDAALLKLKDAMLDGKDQISKVKVGMYKHEMLHFIGIPNKTVTTKVAGGISETATYTQYGKQMTLLNGMLTAIGEIK